MGIGLCTRGHGDDTACNTACVLLPASLAGLDTLTRSRAGHTPQSMLPPGGVHRRTNPEGHCPLSTRRHMVPYIVADSRTRLCFVASWIHCVSNALYRREPSKIWSVSWLYVCSAAHWCPVPGTVYGAFPSTIQTPLDILGYSSYTVPSNGHQFKDLR